MLSFSVVVKNQREEMAHVGPVWQRLHALILRLHETSAHDYCVYCVGATCSEKDGGESPPLRGGSTPSKGTWISPQSSYAWL